MKVHYLKTVQPFFSEVKSGAKTFEHRRNDRDFQVGDLVCLQEYDMLKHEFSGEEIFGKITYVLTDRAGLDNDFCVFSFVTVVAVAMDYTKDMKEKIMKLLEELTLDTYWVLPEPTFAFQISSILIHHP